MGNAVRHSRRNKKKKKKVKGAKMIPLAQMPMKKSPKKLKHQVSPQLNKSGSQYDSQNQSSALANTQSSPSRSPSDSSSSKLLQLLRLRRTKVNRTGNTTRKIHDSIASSPPKKCTVDNNSSKSDSRDSSSLSSSSSSSSLKDSSFSKKSGQFEPGFDEYSRSQNSVQAMPKDELIRGKLTRNEIGQGASDEKLFNEVTAIDDCMESESGMKVPEIESSVINERMRKQVEEWVDRMLKKGVKGLLNEFARLRSETNPNANFYQHFTDNQPYGRNRYKDVFCLDESRIVLRDHPDGNDYIHANYVSTPLMSNRFICTQAPKDETIYDFWLMIVQEHVEVIVMLGDFTEMRQRKSAIYLPRKLKEIFIANDIQIQCNSVTKLSEFQKLMIRRSLTVTRNGNSLSVTHYHWSQWPDHGVPVADRAPLRLFQLIRTAKRPICVHCSAGIGRTGSFVTIAYILECLLTNRRFEDLINILKLLRQQRAGIIQTEMQYLYVHRIMLIYFTDMKLIATSDRLDEFIFEYDRLVSPV